MLNKVQSNYVGCLVLTHSIFLIRLLLIVKKFLHYFRCIYEIAVPANHFLIIQTDDLNYVCPSDYINFQYVVGTAAYSEPSLCPTSNFDEATIATEARSAAYTFRVSWHFYNSSNLEKWSCLNAEKALGKFNNKHIELKWLLWSCLVIKKPRVTQHFF